jgi:hypothetical protein
MYSGEEESLHSREPAGVAAGMEVITLAGDEIEDDDRVFVHRHRFEPLSRGFSIFSLWTAALFSFLLAYMVIVAHADIKRY